MPAAHRQVAKLISKSMKTTILIIVGLIMLISTAPISIAGSLESDNALAFSEKYDSVIIRIENLNRGDCFKEIVLRDNDGIRRGQWRFMEDKDASVLTNGEYNEAMRLYEALFLNKSHRIEIKKERNYSYEAMLTYTPFYLTVRTFKNGKRKTIFDKPFEPYQHFTIVHFSREAERFYELILNEPMNYDYVKEMLEISRKKKRTPKRREFINVIECEPLDNVFFNKIDSIICLSEYSDRNTYSLIRLCFDDVSSGESLLTKAQLNKSDNIYIPCYYSTAVTDLENNEHIVNYNGRYFQFPSAAVGMIIKRKAFKRMKTDYKKYDKTITNPDFYREDPVLIKWNKNNASFKQIDIKSDSINHSYRNKLMGLE